MQRGAGPRWPSPMDDPQPHTGRSATSTGLNAAISSKRSVSPAKYAELDPRIA